MDWLYRQWKLIEGNVKFYLLGLILSGLVAMGLGLISVWQALSWKQLIGAAAAFLSGWIVAVIIVWAQHKRVLTIHYAGWGIGEDRYQDVTTLLKACIKD
jgi:hypothetical protein